MASGERQMKFGKTAEKRGWESGLWGFHLYTGKGDGPLESIPSSFKGGGEVRLPSAAGASGAEATCVAEAASFLRVLKAKRFLG